MTKKYILVFNRNICIGAAACEAAFPERFRIANDGKADLFQAKEISPGIFEVEIDEKMKEKAQQAIDGCPVSAIKFKKNGKS